MADRKKRENRKSSLEAIEAKIEKAKKKVIRTEQAHTAAVKELKDLMDARDVLRRDAIVKLLINSKRSYEEIEAFLKTDLQIRKEKERDRKSLEVNLHRQYFTTQGWLAE